MKIKHFTGYGCVTAKKVEKKEHTDALGNKIVKLIIDVKGNHERGLYLEDAYDLYYWIVKRFDKSVKSYREIQDFSVEFSYNDDVEQITYTFIILKNE